MTATHVSESAPSARTTRILEIVDRGFPLVWIGLYLLLPVSGWATVMFDSWFDQQRDLETLRSVLEHGRADAIEDNLLGPAYIATAALIHWVFGLSPEDSLVALARGSYALSIAAGLVLVRMVVRSLVSAPPLVTLAAQFVFVALVFATGTFHWSDVPWSHFFAAFLAAALFAVRFAPARFGVAHAAIAGALLALLALSRSFELAALIAAWAIALGLLAALRLSESRSWRLPNVVAGAGAFAVTTGLVYWATGKRGLFFLYSNSLDSQSGNVPPAEIAKTPTFSLGFIPDKLVQLFVEPCYYSLCTLADYAGGASPLPPQLAEAAGNERLWRLPLAVQLPSLVLLPVCIAAVAALVVWFARHRLAASGSVRSLRVLIEMTVASTGMVLGYAASTMTGSSHLRYGFARDFLLPALLSGIVAVSLASAGLWLVLSRRRKDASPSPEFGFVVLSVVGAAVLVTAVIYARGHGLPRIESKQLGSVSYTADCRGDACEVRIDATTRSGRAISIPESSTLTFGCGSDRARFTIYAKHPTAGVRLDRVCRDARLVGAWPTVMGLPPGSYELQAVTVRNVG